MDKAIRTIKLTNSFGSITMVITDKNEALFRAYEAATLLGYSDAKACIRKYAKETKLVVMDTDGGKQPVLCTTIDDLDRIAQKSRRADAMLMVAHLRIAIMENHNRDLEIENFMLKYDLGYAIGSLKDLREQLDTILVDLE